MLTKEEVLKIAKLARLALSPSEVENYQNRLGRVLDYVRDLKEVPTSSDGFVKHVPEDSSGYREDASWPFSAVQNLVENAPESEGNCFKLPKIVDQS